MLIGHAGDVFTAAMSADGSRAVTGGADGSGRLWDARAVDPVLLTPLARTRNDYLAPRREARPDPDLHRERRRELEAEGNACGVALQAEYEARARGAAAFDDGAWACGPRSRRGYPRPAPPSAATSARRLGPGRGR